MRPSNTNHNHKEYIIMQPMKFPRKIKLQISWSTR